MKTKYNEKLPRRVSISEARQCQVLTPEGERCKLRATVEYGMHGDQELYDYGRNWVAVCVCDAHAPDEVIKELAKGKRMEAKS